MDGNYYQILGLDPESKPSSKQIKAAYYAQALSYHPDKNPTPTAHADFIAIQGAYGTLSDPVSRANYDAGHATSFVPSFYGPTDGCNCNCKNCWSPEKRNFSSKQEYYQHAYEKAGPSEFEPFYKSSKRDKGLAAMAENFNQAGKRGSKSSKASRRSGKNFARNMMATVMNDRWMWDEIDTYDEML
ncbi:hypothetical protein EAF04_000532 [Stromatinia cepivora]|nr:hypothetical protein EAF04_000532 [Stromatinia cepivora]